MKTVALVCAAALAWAVPAVQAADTVTQLQARYRAAGAGPFDAATGKTLWTSQHDGRGRPRSCTTCHSANLKQPGKHVRTGKTIKPMAPSVNPKRLTDTAKVEKWFTRNCKWTLGRPCTAQEKGDVLSFINSQ